MTRVIQIRDVPDDVHDALVAQAAARRTSLNRFLLEELEHVAYRPEIAAHNRDVIRAGQKRIKSKVTTENVLEVIHQMRGK